MKAETQGKLMVAMLVSILAFGSATGAAILMGYYQSPNQALNLTKEGEFPYIQITRPNINNGSDSQQNLEPQNYSNTPNNPPNNQQNNSTNSST